MKKERVSKVKWAYTQSDCCLPISLFPLVGIALTALVFMLWQMGQFLMRCLIPFRFRVMSENGRLRLAASRIDVCPMDVDDHF